MLLTIIAGFLLTPAGAFAADFELSAWIPYWKASEGVESIKPSITAFTEVNPFMYTVKEDGTLYQALPLSDASWTSLRATAKENGVRFVPTVMWSGSDSIHRILSDPALRAAHIKSIASEVYRNNLDGIDIDYEAKYAKTRESFSTFLKELNEAIGYDKWIMCTIESRTPLDSRYESAEDIPADIEYANDFVAIGKYCDRVRIMAYDQGRIDVQLNKSNADPYIPVADTAWVEKAMRLALQDIPADKLELGVPTYGYEYDMFIGSDGKMQYSRLWSFNPRYPDETIAKLGLTPTRVGGEMVITYPASQSLDPIIPLPNATRVMVWSDEVAIQQKIDLAKRLGLRGVSVFKIDGGQDVDDLPTLAAAGAVRFAIAPPAATPGSTGDSSAGGGSSSIATMPSRNLQTGSTGADVKILQQFLNEQGYVLAAAGQPGSPGNETQKFGAATRAALVAFQKAQGISPAAGYYGPITRAKIHSLFNIASAQ